MPLIPPGQGPAVGGPAPEIPPELLMQLEEEMLDEEAMAELELGATTPDDMAAVLAPEMMGPGQGVISEEMMAQDPGPQAILVGRLIAQQRDLVVQQADANAQEAAVAMADLIMQEVTPQETLDPSMFPG